MRTSTRQSIRLRALLTTLVVGAMTAACGTRVESPDQSAAAPASQPAVSSGLSPAPAGPSSPSVSEGPEPAATGSPDRGNGQAAAATNAPSSSRPASGATSGGGQQGTEQSTPKKGSGPSPAAGPGPGVPPVGPGPAPAPSPAERRSPVTVASVGTYSGPCSSTLLAQLQGVQIWAKHVNSRGGVNGHPVKLVVYDDASDTARHRAQAQDAIERQKAVAFVMNADACAGQGSVDYITSKRVPVVGLSSGEDWAYSSPMLFPQMSAGRPMVWGAIAAAAQQAIPLGKRKLGTIVCAEATVCAASGRLFQESAAPLGFEHVYNGKASIAQPDYTAECLAARNAGAQVMIVLLDTASITRFAASCARQAYQPLYATAAGVLVDRFKDEPNFDGLVGAVVVAPYFQSGTAATDEFRAAFAQQGKGLALSFSTGIGWTAGKMFEKAAATLPEPPTTEAVLQGLWGLNGDDLGGITQPLVFAENKPPAPVACFFTVTIQNRTWTSPDGFERHCVKWGDPTGGGYHP